MRSGPSITIVQKCHGCRFLDVTMEPANDFYEDEEDDLWAVQRCAHPDSPARSPGDLIIYHDTPDWCPLLEQSIQEAAEKATRVCR